MSKPVKTSSMESFAAFLRKNRPDLASQVEICHSVEGGGLLHVLIGFIFGKENEREDHLPSDD